jgi:hypothetical protein
MVGRLPRHHLLDTALDTGSLKTTVRRHTPLACSHRWPMLPSNGDARPQRRTTHSTRVFPSGCFLISDAAGIRHAPRRSRVGAGPVAPASSRLRRRAHEARDLGYIRTGLDSGVARRPLRGSIRKHSSVEARLMRPLGRGMQTALGAFGAFGEGASARPAGAAWGMRQKGRSFLCPPARTRDEAALALCGMLVRGDWPADAVDAFARAVERVAGGSALAHASQARATANARWRRRASGWGWRSCGGCRHRCSTRSQVLT